MKKRYAIMLVWIFLLGLMGCDPGSIRLDRDELLRNTEKIELVEYENPDPKPMRINGKETPVFDFDQATSVATLDPSRFEDIVNDIAQQDLLLYTETLNEPVGKTLILYQSDGTMLVLFGCINQTRWGTNRYYGQCNLYDENGTFIEYLGDIDSMYVDSLESQYFESDT